LEWIAGTLLTGLAAFLATNLDGLFLTAALLSNPASRPRDVVVGTYAGIAFLVAVSAAASLVSLVVPARVIALLGLLPLAIGLKQLWQGRGGEEPPPFRQGMLAVAGINVAFGGDNIGVYTPLFAASPAHAMVLYSAVFAFLTGLLVYAAYRLVTHPGLGAPVRRYGPPLVPWVLIALGAWILLRGL
jgi:cadmium resistance protein CadD (predicted permease)